MHIMETAGNCECTQFACVPIEKGIELVNLNEL